MSRPALRSVGTRWRSSLIYTLDILDRLLDKVCIIVEAVTARGELSLIKGSCSII
jgi:hypothetical protein